MALHIAAVVRPKFLCFNLCMTDNFFFGNTYERSYFDSLRSRDPISDATFHQDHYSNSKITFDTCARVRRVLCDQLRMCNTLPSDNVARIFEDVDISEVCFELAGEFGIQFPKAEIQELDGTVDSLIRLTQRHR